MTSQFHQIYFDQSEQRLQSMAEQLSNFDTAGDDKAINTLFYDALSVKSGAYSFGFEQIGELAQQLEQVIAQLQRHQRSIDEQLKQTLLNTIDVAKQLLAAQAFGKSIDFEQLAQVRQALLALQQEQDTASDDDSSQQKQTESAQQITWQINLIPNSDYFHHVSETMRVFEQLADLGKLTVQTEFEHLPAFFELEPDNCYLSWTLTLSGNISRQDISTIVEPLLAHADITISLVSPELSSDKQQGISSVTSLAYRPAMTVTVDAEQVLSLVDIVSEVATVQSMLKEMDGDLSPIASAKLAAKLTQLEQHMKQMQVILAEMSVSPLSEVLEPLPELVAELARSVDKQVECQITGQQTKLDKAIVDRLAEPLTQLIKNTIQLGIETTEQRSSLGKPAQAQLNIKTYQQASSVVIEISDDGFGLDSNNIRQQAQELGLLDPTDELDQQAVYQLIFKPGISPNAQSDDSQGFIIAADMIQTVINEIGGELTVDAVMAEGTTYTLRFPLAINTITGQVINVANQQYILPLESVVESIEIVDDEIKQIANKGEVYLFEQDYIPVIRLAEVFGQNEVLTDPIDPGCLIIVVIEQQKLALYVDSLVSQQQVLVKSLATHYRDVTGIAGASIMVDGNIALVIDLSGLLWLYKAPHLIDSEMRDAS